MRDKVALRYRALVPVCAFAALALGACNPPAGAAAPVAAPDALETQEDTTLVFPAATLLANDTDRGHGPLAVVSVGPPTAGVVELVGTELRYTPPADFHGAATFEYTVSDGRSEDAATVTVTVAPVNDAPVAADDGLVLDEGAELRVSAASLPANDADVDGDALAVVAIGPASDGAVALVDGDVVFTPAADFHGTATFEYTVSDGTATDTATVTLTARPVNDPPVAADDVVAGAEDAPVAIAEETLLANDVDVDGDELSIVLVGAPTVGRLFQEAGVITLVPPADFDGTVSFEYAVSDGEATDVATVTVAVAPVNDAPVAGDDAAATDEGAAVAIEGTALRANDVDVDGDALAVIAVGDASGGTVTLADGIVTYAPAPGFFGPATFSYTVSDGAASAAAIVTVAVAKVNDAPAAAADEVTTREDVALTITSGALLANDVDADGDPLSVIAVGAPSSGAAVVVPGGVAYTPAADFHGVATFTYTVSDGVATGTATVAVTVTPANDAPVAAVDALSTDEDTPLAIPAAALVGNDTDPDGDALAVLLVGAASSGTVTLSAGTLTYEPAADFHGTATFDYVGGDGDSTDVGTVTVTVAAVNDAPVAVADVAVTAEDEPVVIPGAALVANDVDVDGDALAVVAVVLATGGPPPHGVGAVVF